MKPEAAMPFDVSSKYYTLRCKGKRGQHLSDADIKFCDQVRKKYPKQAAAIGQRAFVDTAPFGAQL